MIDPDCEPLVPAPETRSADPDASPATPQIGRRGGGASVSPSEQRLRQVDRALRALSRGNQILIRAQDEAQLLPEFCRVVVEEAGYRFCWVGYAESDPARSVRPVAHAGFEEGYLQTVNITWADTERGRGPCGTAIRTRAPAIFRNVVTDPAFAPWRAEALRRGYLSVLGLPLIADQVAFGALTIYASEPDAFDAEEVALLEELAGDLVYGIGALRDRAERQRAEAALQRAYDELELRVAERTTELSRTNAQLSQQITERSRAEAALRASEQLYRQLTEGSLDAIVVADEQGRIRLFNPAAQRIFGYEEAEILGKSLTLLMPPEYRTMHDDAVRHYVQTRRGPLVGRTIELHGQRRSGEVFPLEIALSTIELPGGMVFLGAIRDLTERQQMQAQVVQAEKLAALGILSAGMAHEINNPLAYVAGNLDVLERNWNDLSAVLAAYDAAGPTLAAVRPDLAAQINQAAAAADLPYLRANLGRILQSTRQGVSRVSDIVRNLREFARLDQAAIDRVDLHQAITSSLELVRGRLKQSNIRVDCLYGTLPPIVCAPVKINQVVLNLLVNALQAIEATGRAGGRIEIRTDTRQDCVLLEVADDGCGIPAEVLPRIFDPFFTTKPVGEGTGLGLSITHGIITDHGGRIEVESHPDQGSRFRITLPLHGPGPSTNNQPRAPLPEAAPLSPRPDHRHPQAPSTSE